MKKIYVETVYGMESFRDPNIEGYDSKEEAEAFISTCLQWGIDIVSCKIIPTPKDTV